MIDEVLMGKVLKNYVENLKKKVAERLGNAVHSYSGFNSSLANENILKRVEILNDYDFWLNLDTDITKRTAFRSEYETTKKYEEIIAKAKNDIVDVICPKREMGKGNYHENMRKAGALANLLEGLLRSAYMDGLNTRLLKDTAEFDKVEQEYFKEQGKTLDHELHNAYMEGSNMLLMAMAGALAGNEVCQEVLKKGN